VSTVGAFALVAGGVVLLGTGAELLVRGATAIARIARMSPAVIGLTIVAMGTSLPELTVGVTAAVRGTAAVGIGNVMGVNVFNICVVLGLSALVQPMRVHSVTVRLEWPVMFLAAWQCLLLVRDGSLDRLEGGYFTIALVIFTAYAVRIARADVAGEEAKDMAEEVLVRTFYGRLVRIGPSLGFIAVGVGLLVVGGNVLLRGAVSLAHLIGMSERVIGLTVVAMGTGLPEVAASLAAARRGQSEMALGNVIGSNIVNVFGVLGAVAWIHPLDVNVAEVSRDVWWMVGVSALLLPIMRRGYQVSRGEGLFLLMVYGAYLLTLGVH
jgi:cation:H+ antiporter